MTDTDKLARRIVIDVLNNLGGRKGFDWWWDSVDEDIQHEMFTELVELVKGHLDNPDRQIEEGP